MEDPTRAGDGDARLEVWHAKLIALVDELMHLVLQLFREQGIGLAEELKGLGGDPLTVVEVFVVALRSLADGLESPLAD